MSFAATLPNHLRPRREKVFGDGPRQPLDREAKIRIATYARAMTQRMAAGKAYGAVTAKALEVLKALLWSFHNAKSGQCDPSYETIAAKADCARSTVAEAIKALEAAGLLSWVNRITRERVPERDLFGKWSYRWRVIRRSNAYLFRDPKRPDLSAGSSKSEKPTGTTNQAFISSAEAPCPVRLDPENPVEAALLRLGMALGLPESTKN